MAFLKKIRAQLAGFEEKYPGAILLALVIALLAISDIFFKTSINEMRYIWYRLYEAGGKDLFYLFGGNTELDPDAYYDPPTWILSIKHQLASVLAMYAVSSSRTLKRMLYAVTWFALVQPMGIIKYAIALKLSLANPDNLFAISEQPFHLVLWLVPFVYGMRKNKLPLQSLWKPGAKHPLGAYSLVLTRILAILTVVSTFRVIDLVITNSIFQGDRISLWQSGDQLFNIILRWPVLHGANIVLQQFMYNTTVQDHVITDGLTSILIGVPCLGKGVLFVFSVIIVLTNTTWQHKAWCIFSGLVVLIMFNIARMSLLFTYVYEFGSASYNYQTWHDIYSGIIYLAIVGLWIICTSGKIEPDPFSNNTPPSQSSHQKTDRKFRSQRSGTVSATSPR